MINVDIKEYEELPKLLFREDLEIVGFEILKMKDFYEKYDSSLLASPKILKFYEILFIEDGQGKHFIDFETYSFKRGSILFIGKNQTHSWQEYRSSNGYIILFTENFLYKNQMQFNELSYSYPYNTALYSPITNITNNKHFISFLSLIKLIYEEYRDVAYQVRQEVLQSLLRTLILKIKSQLPTLEIPNDDKKTLFIQFQKALDQHMFHTRNAKDYIDMLGCSAHQLNLVVKTFTNKSVKVFIDSMLILNAKRLLADSQYNVSEASYLLGFEETTNFTKFFKKHTNQTPSQFKEVILKQG
ncbi:helix-turn-helix domain-containing protein [Tenacibaculum aiptasiae]|uniref:helix-turn-helix domain-containing protein n=1 Tax=Tenacibaculum aiptasiae TaxID=426481 RepID=UPI0023311E49|nr:helix-turn-helix domain-containing protein [Tenacibaculum aiptasiae]